MSEPPHLESVPEDTRGRLFDQEYYRTGFGPQPYERNDSWLAVFGGMADEIIRSLQPRRVLDAGCALGMLVESFWDRGVSAYGTDISEFAISRARPDMQPFCSVRSLTEPIEERYDLITCIEVLEHMPAADVARAIENMTAATDTVLFSSTPFDFDEPTHCHVRPMIYWIEQFDQCGFAPDVGFNASFVAPHAMLFRRSTGQTPHEVKLLFAEKMRLQCALVEREQRIGRLSGERDKVSADLSAFLAKNQEMAQVIDGLSQSNQEMHLLVEGLRRNLQEQEARVTALGTELGQAVRDRDELESVWQALTQQLAEAAAVRRSAPEGRYAQILGAGQMVERLRHSEQELQRRTAQMTEELRNRDAAREGLRVALADAESTIAQLRSETAQAMAATEQALAAAAIEQANAEAAALLASPAWRLISGYRRWLEGSRNRWWMRSLYEPMVSGALRGLRLSAPLLTSKQGELAVNAPPAQPAPVAEPAVDTPARARRPVADEAVQPPGPSYAEWIAANEPDQQVLSLQTAVSEQFRYRPLVSVLVPVFQVPLTVLQAMVDSVRRQTYTRWELCVVHAYPADQAGRDYLRAAAELDDRIKVELLPENLGISGNSNAALQLVTGEFLALLDHDDMLAPFALYEVVKALNEEPDLEFVYSDKDSLTADGSERIQPLFKPQWSPGIMLSVNYLTHFCVLRTSTVRAVGGWHAETDGAQDWDLFLRVIGFKPRVGFIPKVLYHWRVLPTSVASTGFQAKPYAATGQLRALNTYLDHQGLNARAAFLDNGALKILWHLPETASVTVFLLCQGGAANARELARRRRDQTANVAQPLDILVLAPGSEDYAEDRIRGLAWPEGRSLAEQINEALRQTTSEYLIVLDETVEIGGERGWLEDFVGPLQQPGVGLVSPKLVDSETRRIRHAGIVFNADGTPDYIFADEPEHICAEFGGGYWCRNWTAASGACFAIRRDVFAEAGGMATSPVYPRLDVDLCLRLQLTTGRQIFYNPFARFRQTGDAWLEQSPTDAGRQHEAAAYIRGCFPAGDPYFHPELESRRGKVRFRRRGDDPSAAKGVDYNEHARALLAGFDCSPQDVDRSQRAMRSATPDAGRGVQDMTWFVPEFSNPFYGGIHTILRFAEYFRSAHRVRSRFVVIGSCPASQIRARIERAFPELAGDCDIALLQNYGQLDSLPVTDAVFSTLWTTAYAALRFENTRGKFYFLQDHESLFYPAGSISALVEATYRFGFKAVCNTIALSDIYRQAGGDADYFTPCVDTSIFFPPQNGHVERSGGPYRVFCYARPGHPRNGFELLTSALRLIKQRFGDGVEILTAGADWDPATFGLQGTLTNLGMLGYRTTAALYRSCDAGVVMMMTAHPSYLPLELMACGSLVITNENPHTRWLLKDGDNCLLARTTPSAVADAIERGLRDRELRARIAGNAQRLVQEQFSDWSGQAEKVYRYVDRAVRGA